MTVLADHALLGTARTSQTPLVPRTRRLPARRQAALRRPGGRPFPYGSVSAVVGVSRAPHAPTSAQVRRRRVLAWLVLTVLAVAAFAGLVALRSAGTDVVPSTTAVVRVQAGESLSVLAGRVAPDAPTAAVVERIVSLNGLTGATVRPGESLVVPLG